MSRMCPVCGKREIGPRAEMCESCGCKRNREYYFRIGVCPVCKKNKLFGTERMCPECRANAAERQFKRYYAQYEKVRIQTRASRKRVYDRRKSEGICTRCGTRKAQPGKALCKMCAIKKSNRETQDIPRSERVSHGLCYFCGESLDREGRSCKKCAERCTRTIAPYRPGKTKAWSDANELLFRKRGKDEV